MNRDHHRFALVREALSSMASASRWWKIMDLCDGASGSEAQLLQDTVERHVKEDLRWEVCRVPCGDWRSDHRGWKKSRTLTRRVPLLGGVKEVYCPPGSFQMGACANDPESFPGEGPAREVSLSKGFWALTTPITVTMAQEVRALGVGRGRHGLQPLGGVSWWDAIQFCNLLSSQAGLEQPYRVLSEHRLPGFETWSGRGPLQRGATTGLRVEWDPAADGFRLPTEAEWEYLCRAGSSGPRYGNRRDVAWTAEDTQHWTSHVTGTLKQRRPNAWGIFDTLGGVWEWCVDEFLEGAYQSLPTNDPAYTPVAANRRVQRGGSRSGERCYARASHRSWNNPMTAFDSFGFRVVRNAAF